MQNAEKFAFVSLQNLRIQQSMHIEISYVKNIICQQLNLFNVIGSLYDRRDGIKRSVQISPWRSLNILLLERWLYDPRTTWDHFKNVKKKITPLGHLILCIETVQCYWKINIECGRNFSLQVENKVIFYTTFQPAFGFLSTFTTLKHCDRRFLIFLKITIYIVTFFHYSRSW